MLETLSGRASLFTSDIDAAKLKRPDGAKYLMDHLRPHFVRDQFHMFLFRYKAFQSCRRNGVDFMPWFAILNKRLKQARDAWSETVARWDAVDFEKWKAWKPPSPPSGDTVVSTVSGFDPVEGLTYSVVYDEVEAKLIEANESHVNCDAI